MFRMQWDEYLVGFQGQSWRCVKEGRPGRPVHEVWHSGTHTSEVSAGRDGTSLAAHSLVCLTGAISLHSLLFQCEPHMHVGLEKKPVQVAGPRL